MQTAPHRSRSIVPFVPAAVVVAALALGVAGCGRLFGGGGTPKTEDEKTLYALGQMLGHSIAVFDMDARDLEIVKTGLSDAVLNRKPAVDGDAYRAKLQPLARARSARATQRVVAAAARDPGAIKTPSGMVIRTVKPGTGAAPAVTDQVKVQYEGRLVDGTVFDSTRKRGEPATFPLNGVIKCWTEGVARMKVGEKAVLTCPPELAYGDQGSPPNVPGGATLTFDVELLGIVK